MFHTAVQGRVWTKPFNYVAELMRQQVEVDYIVIAIAKLFSKSAYPFIKLAAGIKGFVFLYSCHPLAL